MEEQVLHDRLRIAAGERTYKQLSKLTETHQESVRRYMQGHAPSVEFLTNFCSSLEINASWLLTGQGPMNDHEVQPHALRTAETPDLLRALSDTVSVLIGRVDRLERLVHTTEIKLRSVTGRTTLEREPDGSDARLSRERTETDSSTNGRAEATAARIGAALTERASQDDDRDDASRGA